MLVAFVPPAAATGARARYGTCSAEQRGLIDFYFFKPQRARQLPTFSHEYQRRSAVGDHAAFQSSRSGFWRDRNTLL
jgi:hypothetical protein